MDHIPADDMHGVEVWILDHIMEVFTPGSKKVADSLGQCHHTRRKPRRRDAAQSKLCRRGHQWEEMLFFSPGPGSVTVLERLLGKKTSQEPDKVLAQPVSISTGLILCRR